MKNNIRYSVQLDNADKHELSTSIQESINSMNKKHGDMSRVKLKITDSEISIWLGNDDPFMVKEFWDYMAELRDEVALKVADNGYTYDKWNRQNEYLVLRYPKGNYTQSPKLIRFIKEEIGSAYAEYEQTSTAKVIQNNQEIQIWFDSENPYLEKNFWHLINKVKEAIHGRVKEEGFTFKRTECLYDYVILHYQNDSET